jgi:hypothetical protein
MGHVSFIPAGRLGNFLWECAVAFCYAEKHGLKFSVPKSTSHDFWSPIYLHHLIDPEYNPQAPAVMVQEKQFHYDGEIEFREEWRGRNIILHGYWQSWRYIEGYKAEILEAFNLPWYHIPDVCSIHARFGDYLTYVDKHIIVDEPYLRSAVEFIKAETGIVRFKVYSDDIPYFKANLGHIYDFEYSTNKGIMEDLVEISCCHSHINSSSTFSWWGSYLNKNPDKVIVTQRSWFREGWRDDHGVVNTKDIIPSNWVKL